MQPRLAQIAAACASPDTRLIRVQMSVPQSSINIHRIGEILPKYSCGPRARSVVLNRIFSIVKRSWLSTWHYGMGNELLEAIYRIG